MAISPAPREPPPPACARAKVPFANKPAPITAPPARSPPFIKDRRSTDCLKDGGSASLVMCMLQIALTVILFQLPSVRRVNQLRDTEQMSYNCQLCWAKHAPSRCVQ